ncbi:MAG: VOC family protein [Sphaerospermopsis sp.]|nr:VOC family protein [Sphaerospermopsis sp.]
MVLKHTDIFVTIATTDVEKILDYYTQLLGLQPIVHMPSLYAELQLQGLRLAIFKSKTAHESEFANSDGSKMSLCFQVTNLENAIAQLTTLGYPPPGEIINDYHGREIYAYDPDGNRIILHESKAGGTYLDV